MSNKAKLIFVVVVVISSLLIKTGFSISEIQPKDVITNTIGAVVAVLIISYLQNRNAKQKD